MEPTTGRQRLLATVLGIPFDDSTSVDQLSEAIEREKARRHDLPTRGQRHIARQWGVHTEPSDKFEDLHDRLWQAAVARTLVFSVARRTAAADWRFHAQSGLPQEVVSRIALAVLENPQRRAFVLEMDDSLSDARGDAWCRFGKSQTEHPAFKFVESQLRESGVGRRPAPRPTVTPPVADRKRKGCLAKTVILLIAIAAAVVMS